MLLFIFLFCCPFLLKAKLTYHYKKGLMWFSLKFYGIKMCPCITNASLCCPKLCVCVVCESSAQLEGWLSGALLDICICHYVMMLPSSGRMAPIQAKAACAEAETVLTDNLHNHKKLFETNKWKNSICTHVFLISGHGGQQEPFWAVIGGRQDDILDKLPVYFRATLDCGRKHCKHRATPS